MSVQVSYSKRVAVWVLLTLFLVDGVHADPANSRRPRTDAELEYWLQNMVWHHRFTDAEITAAIGLDAEEIARAKSRFNITGENAPQRKPDAALLTVPYPGGRHPRIGFLDGAVAPQRETKISVFTPWDPRHYVVADIPEAIWSNLGLTYLAHTHVETIWNKSGIELPRHEWQRNADGTLEMTRRLPNGIEFGTRVVPGREGVRMSMWLKNGTPMPLTGLRVQNCVMLKGAPGFNQQTTENKLSREPYMACRSEKGDRWIITAWTPLHRAWGNDRCPCLHADPIFPDCKPGETSRIRGWLSFYEGSDIQAEFDRLDTLGWQKEQ